ncbi:CheR family methyltransferase [Sporomusa acidovorans]|uniref:protein-glutamate O-methyltransferase n=1 Tax=Sporomusa acidovorans (strain ATCC 49682 / DSM 3132 / Mol) TaxID=1123286 RepID=A0ABZ3J7N3_SPOA4|nr:protein-glutamate O-methyltransferase CheR [Sporomusa acidovorans]OZC16676.1 putative biofilm formation methyltransferase WspC [Sporomusa acidovorans DSM 3132]SDE06541.1 chemotaxis protein methyltransferase CheR [Sporomusa acidovorans]
MYELEKISLFINKQYGLEFRQQRLKLLQEAIQMRMKTCRMTSIGDYLQLIEQQPKELLLLVNLLTVHETYFFREPSHFTILSRELIPQLVKARSPYPFLRLMSAGCSTGEEAYSLAIAALAVPGAGIDWDFEVIGIDVDEKAIKKAQAGVYGLYSFRSCPKAIRDKYFYRVKKEQFMIKHAVKEKIRFETLNLFEQAYPDWMPSLDIIFYRNVSIYFSKEQRKALFQRLADLLNIDGCLFLSCTETLYHNNRKIPLIKNGETFYYQKQAGNSLPGQTVARMLPTTGRQPTVNKQLRPAFPSLRKKQISKIIPHCRCAGVTRTKTLSSTDSKGTRCRQLFAAALDLLKSKQYKEALNRLDEIVALDSSYVKAYTLKATILLNQEQLEAAVQFCRQALSIDSLCLEAYLLLGMATKLAGQPVEAMQRFREAIYVAPECWLAHFYLAEVYQLQEEDTYAQREYEITIKILKQGNFVKHGLSFFSVPFQQDDFIQLCKHNLAKLQN